MNTPLTPQEKDLKIKQLEITAELQDKYNNLFKELEVKSKSLDDKINDASNKIDNKIDSLFKFSKHLIWALGLLLIPSVVIAVLFGVKSFKDIVSKAESNVVKYSVENAKEITSNKEFRGKIDKILVEAVNSRTQELTDIKEKIASINSELSESDNKKLINRLFDGIEPRLSKLEKLEKHGSLVINENHIDIIKDGHQYLAIETGKSTINPGRIKASIHSFIPSGLIKFSKSFKEVPQVFVQIATDSKSSSPRRSLRIDHTIPTKDGFLVLMNFGDKAEDRIFLPNENIELSWFAIGL